MTKSYLFSFLLKNANNNSVRGYLALTLQARGEQRMKQRNNMAASKRSVPKVDYKKLNALLSVVLFDTSTKKVKSRKSYGVERIIEHRKAKYVRFP